MKLAEYPKIKSMEEIRKYGLPYPETVFVFNFREQERQIDDFLKNREFVDIRTDTRRKADFCPNSLRCPKSKAKAFIKQTVNKGYAAILQEYVPIRKGRIASGNILVLKNHFLVELIGKGPLTLLNRKGRLAEQIKLRKDDFREVEHFGKRLIKKKKLLNIVKMARGLPRYKILEFTLLSKGLFFWHIREDKTAKVLES